MFGWKESKITLSCSSHGSERDIGDGGSNVYMLSPVAIIMPGICQVLLLLSCLWGCQRDVLAQFPCMEPVVRCRWSQALPCACCVPGYRCLPAAGLLSARSTAGSAGRAWSTACRSLSFLWALPGIKGRALAVPCIMQTAPSPYADVSFSSEKESINSSRAYKAQHLDVKLLDKICLNLGRRNKDLVKRATCGRSPFNILFLMFLFTVKWRQRHINKSNNINMGIAGSGRQSKKPYGQDTCCIMCWWIYQFT